MGCTGGDCRSYGGCWYICRTHGFDMGGAVFQAKEMVIRQNGATARIGNATINMQRGG